jgi:hypothetical protein
MIVFGPFRIARFLTVPAKQCAAGENAYKIEADWFGSTRHTTREIDELNVRHITKAAKSRFFISSTAIIRVYSHAPAYQECCLKDGDVPKSPCSCN